MNRCLLVVDGSPRRSGCARYPLLPLQRHPRRTTNADVRRCRCHGGDPDRTPCHRDCHRPLLRSLLPLSRRVDKTEAEAGAARQGHRCGRRGCLPPSPWRQDCDLCRPPPAIIGHHHHPPPPPPPPTMPQTTACPTASSIPLPSTILS